MKPYMSSVCYQRTWVCVSVCDVVSEGCVSLQQPQEKCLLEEPQGPCATGSAADLQPWLVWNGCTSQTCRYQLRHILRASGWTVCQLNGFACCLCSYCPEMMLQNFKQELAAQLMSFQKGRPLEEYGLTVPNQQNLVYEWVSQQREILMKYFQYFYPICFLSSIKVLRIHPHHEYLHQMQTRLCSHILLFSYLL